MAVVIENIDIPESCDKCPLCNHTYTYYFCPLLRTILDDEMVVIRRHNDCYLKPSLTKELVQSKIVRCKDCSRGIVKENMVICFEDNRMMRIKGLNDYCSCGVNTTFPEIVEFDGGEK